jgi:hypothetical protein
MHIEDVVAAAVPAELADRLEERQAFDVADRAATSPISTSQPSAAARMRI